ncbi:hypothetical protein PUN28_013596 [Cardiocondyla obscurior]|uniref:Uncharacterized protein n=1 Tax=Cardiocondyla obscurior TaxID=286306 RepID=A0AAW2F5D4_9HYME
MGSLGQGARARNTERDARTASLGFALKSPARFTFAERVIYSTFGDKQVLIHLINLRSGAFLTINASSEKLNDVSELGNSWVRNAALSTRYHVSLII